MADDEQLPDGPAARVTAATLLALRDAARADREAARAARLDALREAATLLTRARTEFGERFPGERDALRERLVKLDAHLEELERELRAARAALDDD